jgi:cytochrome b6-f complex iron-sulfur subunit
MPEPNTNITENPSPPPPPGPSSAVTAAPPKPALPPKPAPPAKPPTKKPGTSRRFFLIGSWITLGWITLTGSLLAMVLGTLRFLFPNVLSEPPSSFKAGDINAFEENKVTDRYKEVGAWVIRARDDRGRDTVYALSTTCTHLGCTPNWLEAEMKFKCPCHGSGFKISGVNFEGPAPRPLERYAVRKGDDNQVIVDKARKFQKELGQWDDADSYIILG